VFEGCAYVSSGFAGAFPEVPPILHGCLPVSVCMCVCVYCMCVLNPKPASRCLRDSGSTYQAQILKSQCRSVTLNVNVPGS
jgi:hypothetical protein